jgi:hypothetical protein
MPRSEVLIDEIANELATWPGVHIQPIAQGAARVLYEHSTLGLLYPDRGVAELHGRADVTAVLELFDRRYRDVRGEDDPYSSQDPD